ncbi:MAG: hypothetical protein WCL29_06445, partial [Pseudomonadota bacterium]
MFRRTIKFCFITPCQARRFIAICGMLVVCAAYCHLAAAGSTRLPSFAELESAGAVIGKISINPQNIFDLTDDAENQFFFQWVNRLHIPTRAIVIERVLLFKSGERVSCQKIDETERLLRGSRTRYDVDIKPITYHDGVVDIEVSTRDAWTLNLTGSYSRAGGNNKTSFGIVEQNLFGSAISIGYSQTTDLDRKGLEFEMSVAQVFDGWTNVNFARGRFDDGRRTTLT